MRTALLLCALPWIALVGGCRLLDPPESAHDRSPLRPARPSPDSLALEIIWLRFPLDDPQLGDAVWQEIDETRVAPAVRRELAHNGLRVGVVGGTLPDAIARMIEPDGTSPDSSAQAEAGTIQGDLMADPTVRRRMLQLRRGRRAEIQASDVYDTLPLLRPQNRELGGDIYHDAQAIYALRVDPRSDRSANVEITPELHYGAARLRWTSEDAGMLRQAPLRDREVFTPLRISAPLAPGEMLVMTCLPDSASRLGHYFHTAQTATGREQKMILVRLAQVPPSDAFDASEEL